MDEELEVGDRTKGARLLAEILTSTELESPYCGLLTNHATKDDEEYYLKDRDSFGITLPRPFTISKAHLEGAAAGFSEALRVGLMGQLSDTFLRCVADALQRSISHALKELTSISPAEFEHLAFGLTRPESVSELDMVLRLFTIEQP